MTAKLSAAVDWHSQKPWGPSQLQRDVLVCLVGHQHCMETLQLWKLLSHCPSPSEADNWCVLPAGTGEGVLDEHTGSILSRISAVAHPFCSMTAAPRYPSSIRLSCRKGITISLPTRFQSHLIRSEVTASLASSVASRHPARIQEALADGFCNSFAYSCLVQSCTATVLPVTDIQGFQALLSHTGEAG